ncbi:type VI secretion system baseplate subunit TssG [Phycisphaeraceae bacterium D3-23]
MASQGSGHPDHLIDRLVADGRRYDFNQAVRLIYRLAHTQPEPATLRRGELGTASPPADEPVRFATRNASGFPASAIHHIRPRKADDASATPTGFDITVQFAGLTGPNGVLPRHFTSLLIAQSRANNFSLERFQNLFNHRLISLFHRAWEKHQFPIAIEQTAVRGDKTLDPFTRCLFALMGMGHEQTRKRMSIDDRSLLFFAGHYARRVPTAAGIRDTVAEYFGVAVRIEQFVGQWLEIEPDDRSQMGTALRPDGLNMALGINAVLGDRIWYAQAKFRLHLGPLGFADYCSFLPDQRGLRRLSELVRMHVGPQFEFDVVPILKAQEVPPCELGADPAPRLGWTTFLTTQTPASDFAGARFEHAEV